MPKVRFKMSEEDLKRQYGNLYYPGMKEDWDAGVFGEIKTDKDIPSASLIAQRRQHISLNPQDIGKSSGGWKEFLKEFFIGSPEKVTATPTVSPSQQAYQEEALEEAPENIRRSLEQYQQLAQQIQQNPLYQLQQLRALDPNAPSYQAPLQLAAGLLGQYAQTPQAQQFAQNIYGGLGSALGALGSGAQQGLGALGGYARSGLGALQQGLGGQLGNIREGIGNVLESLSPNIFPNF